jgi:serine/threonine protein phosphatase 1
MTNRNITGKPEPEEGRLLAVGDIHRNDQVVFLGDYSDRGPDPRGVIDYLLKFRQQCPDTVFLKGNHEAMLLDYLEGRNRLLYLMNGGAVTLDGYSPGGRVLLPPEHLDFFRRLRLYFETDEFIFVHAGLRPGTEPADQSPEDLLWIRDEFLESDYDWGKTVVFGHTPLRNPYFSDRRIGLDTGAGHGHSLTCCEVRRRECWSAS